MSDIRPAVMIGTYPFSGVGEILAEDRLLGIVNEKDFEPNSVRVQDSDGDMSSITFDQNTLLGRLAGDTLEAITLSDLTTALDLTYTDPRATALITLTGLPENSTSLGIFNGSSISDNVSIKQALQTLETLVEAIDTNGALTVLSLESTAALKYTDENSNVTNIPLISTDAGNVLNPGTDGKLLVSASSLDGETLTSLSMEASSVLEYDDENENTTSVALKSADANNLLQTGSDNRLWVPAPSSVLKSIDDWNLIDSAANYELTITAAEHGRGTNVSADIYDTSSSAGFRTAFNFDSLRINRTSGEIRMVVSASPDGREDIEAIVHMIV